MANPMPKKSGPARRSKRACSNCRGRKIRCDLVGRGGSQCTNCFLDQKTCIIAPSARADKQPYEKVFDFATDEPRLPSHLRDAEIKFLRAKGALCLPQDAELNALLSGFVDFVHPQLPFLDLQRLHGDIRAMVLAGSFSLFLMHALIASAFPHVDGKIIQLLKFTNAREGSKCYQKKAACLLEVNYEQHEQDFIQGHLLLSLCTRNSTDGSEGGIGYIAEAISRAREAGYHLGESARPEMSLDERRAGRRLWWSCYVQDRLSNLLTGRKPCIADEDIAVAPPSLEDFDFYHMTTSKTHSSSALPRDTLSQIFLVYLFKWKVELCKYLTSEPADGSNISQQIGDRLEMWHQQFLESVSSQALSSQSVRCLNVHWESLVLLYRTVVVLIARKRWIIESQRLHYRLGHSVTFGDMFLSPHLIFSLQEALSGVARLASQLRHRKQLQNIQNGGLWALLPSMMTIIQLVSIESTDLQLNSLRDIYDECLLVLESQSEHFEAVASSLPFVWQMLSKLPGQTSSPGIPFSNFASESPEGNSRPSQPASIVSWDHSSANNEQICTLSQLSMCFDTETAAENFAGSTPVNFDN